MSFFRSLFGKSNSSKVERGIEEHRGYLEGLRLPAIVLAGSADHVVSRIGGLPALPSHEPWPMWKDKPLAFLCQLALSEIPDECERHGLPSSGCLYFFYDQDQQTWGFDPQDKGSWHVLYTAATGAGSEPCTPPSGLREDAIHPEKRLRFKSVQTYPDWQDERVAALDLSDVQADQYVELCSQVFGGQPAHHLFGYPSPVQGNDMDLECQLVSHGLYCGDATGYRHPQAQALAAGRHDWMLLLQLDTDDDADMMWGDCGILYFWIRKDDLRNTRFDRCWLILQCS